MKVITASKLNTINLYLNSMRRVVSNSQHMFSGELPIKLDDNDIELLMDNMRELSEDIESFKDTLHYS